MTWVAKLQESIVFGEIIPWKKIRVKWLKYKSFIRISYKFSTINCGTDETPKQKYMHITNLKQNNHYSSKFI